MQTGFFFQALVYLCAAVVAVPIARRLGLGSVLGYLLAGAAIGPFALGLVGREGADVLHFAEVGVVMMLFLIGLELEAVRLWALRGALLGLGGIQVVATSLAIGVTALALGAEWRVALVAGLVLALSSTAIALQSLREKGLARTDAGERAFAVLLFQDLAVIPMLVLLPLLGAHAAGAGGAAHGATAIDALPAWGRALATLAAVAAIVLAGRFVVPPLFRAVARSGVREAFTAAALLLVVAIVLLMQSVGLSPALGTFLGGVVLASSEFRHELEGDIEPFKGLLLGLFFLSVGASIDFGVVAANGASVAALVVGLVAVKAAVLLALGRAARLSAEQNLLFAAALAQGGEFAFVLFSLAAQGGVLAPEEADLLVATVALSMAATPLLLLGWERAVRPRFGARRAAREPDAIDREGPVILAGFGAFGSIVGRFLLANGVETVVLDADSDHVALMRGFGIRAYYGDASREELLRAAGAERARLLIVATGSLETMRKVIHTAKHDFPKLRVAARARSRVEAYELLDAGADAIYRASLDTALRSGADALRALGFPAYHAHRAAQRFRRHDEASWRELAAVRRDERVFQSRARESLQLLERLLREERDVPDPVDDNAWDAASLRAERARRDATDC
ncbi:MAG: potassium transporter [Proteobacteria bacterium]|nr:MAG: potassium transporter [Pseudomonadota bacterium]